MCAACLSPVLYFEIFSKLCQVLRLREGTGFVRVAQQVSELEFEARIKPTQSWLLCYTSAALGGCGDWR